jgi:hypothetical protein
MTARGEELLAAVKGVRNFFGDLSQLLVAGDALLGERSWEPAGDPHCLAWLSSSVHQGHQWVPRVAFRRYTNPAECPRVLAQISLLLDDHDMDFKLTEPVVTGSYFDFTGATAEEKLQLKRRHACWFGYRSPPLDGTPLTITDTDPSWAPSWRWRHMQVFGRPLVEVTSQASLQQVITDPLLHLIRQHRGQAGPGFAV